MTRRLRVVALFGFLAASSVASMWGFTVDDALVSVRYAMRLASGAGYRFDAAGAVTDGVTPLPWPFVLAALAGGSRDALAVLWRARVFGAACVVASSLLVGRVAAREETPGWARVFGAVALALPLPLAAHASSGMETALVTLLATAASTCLLRGGPAAAILAGIAATFRPELLPWSVLVAGGSALVDAPRGEASAPAAGDGAPRLDADDGVEGQASRDGRVRLVSVRAAALRLLAGVGPFASCAAVRALVFGNPAPLSVRAKPSDLAHGLTYAGAAIVVGLVPLLVFAPRAVLRSGVAVRVLALAAIAHAAAIAAAGGDWMPYGRLVVPVLPSLVVLFLAAAPRMRVGAAIARFVAMTALGVLLAVRAGPAGRHVARDRAALVARAAPTLASLRTVAALDIGWVSAATGARIVDLAGLTDPVIASLPGGHTSKRVSAAMLLEREPDALLVYASGGLTPGLTPTYDAVCALPGLRNVERHLLADALVEERFSPAEVFLLGDQGAGYVLLARMRAR